MLTIRLSDIRYDLPLLCRSDAEKPDWYRITADVDVQLFDGRYCLLPAGFDTDLHSVPSLLQPWLPAYEAPTNLAAGVHDRLYENWAEHITRYPELKGVDGRQYADQAYLALMQHFSPGTWHTNLIRYAGVRIAGRARKNWTGFRTKEQLSA